jgi:hypothetical protein
LYLGIKVFVNTTKNLNPSAAVKVDLHRIHEVNKLVATKKACSKENNANKKKDLKNINKSGVYPVCIRKEGTKQTIKQ